jgi:hypothetical protein
MPQPWGTGKAEPFFAAPAGEAANTSGRARTHYAVDYTPSGASGPVGRFVFLDTSTRTLATSQNPDEPQGSWLATELVTARNASVPTFVVMNMPTRDPSSFANDMILPAADVTTIENAAFSGGTTAVFSGGVRVNASYKAPDGTPGAVPYYVAGTGGAPLGRSTKPNASKAPTDGYYHSWLFATVDPSTVTALQPQAKLTVRTVPVIESVSLVPKNGLAAPGGSTLEFSAIARALEGGGPKGQQDAGRRNYQKFPVICRTQDVEANGEIDGCFTRRATIPEYRFISEDPGAATFVRRLADTDIPLRAAGRLIADATSGLLCTFRTGEVWVRIESGGRQARLPVNIHPGKGPCVGDAVIDPIALPEDVDAPEIPAPVVREKTTLRQPEVVAAVKPPKIPAPNPPVAAKPPAPVTPAPQPEPSPVVKPIPKVFLITQPVAELTPALVPPAPSMLPSPAPPASASAAGAEKQEEKEVEHEGASQEGGDFIAISHRRDAFDPTMGWMLVSTAALLGLFGAAVAATMRSARGHEPARATVYYPRELR